MLKSDCKLIIMSSIFLKPNIIQPTITDTLILLKQPLTYVLLTEISESAFKFYSDFRLVYNLEIKNVHQGGFRTIGHNLISGPAGFKIGL